MREMVLNHASVLAPGSDRESVTQWLKDLARGMGGLVEEGIVQSSLRMSRWYGEIPCLPDLSLWDVLHEFRKQGFRDEYALFLKVATRSSFQNKARPEIMGRFRACEERTLTPPDGEPLVICAIDDGIAVGFPSAPEWERDRVTVYFDELLPDGTSGLASEEIDQLTRSVHAGPISDRHRARVRAGSDSATLWMNRDVAFPNLAFGPDVEGNLKDYSNLLLTIVGKLVELDRSAGEWKARGGRAPRWRTHVSPEKVERMKNATFRETRRFRSHLGTREIFEWHARFGDHGRIHLRFDPESYEVEVGYIGWHLPG